MEATVCLGYLDLCQGVPWTVSVQNAASGDLHNRADEPLQAEGGEGAGGGHVYIAWWCAAELAPSVRRQRRCGHRSNGLLRQSGGVAAAASSSRPCGHRGRQAACGNGFKLRDGRKKRAERLRVLLCKVRHALGCRNWLVCQRQPPKLGTAELLLLLLL